MKKVYITLILIFLLNALSYSSVDSQKRKEIIGGMCEYLVYTGQIIVLDIKKTEESKLQNRMYGGPDYEGYEITYKFISDKIITEDFAKEWIEKEQVFRFFNSWFPSEEYIAIHNIEVNKSYPAKMMVIERGTCTPVMIEVEGWERNIDY